MNRPTHVNIALKILYMVTIISLLKGFYRHWQQINLGMRSIHGNSLIEFTLLSSLLAIAIFYLIFRIGRGQNWAKYGYTLLVMVGILSGSWRDAYHGRLNFDFLFAAFLASFQLGAVILLYSKRSRAWFFPKKAEVSL